MQTLHKTVKFFMDAAKVQAVMNRRFDSGLGGLGWNEFVILHSLAQAEGGRMRRVDLAERIGLTPSGVTRILLPMEKVGYVKKEVNRDDARSSLVMLAPGGRHKLEEGLERAEFLVEELFPSAERREMEKLGTLMARIGRHLK